MRVTSSVSTVPKGAGKGNAGSTCANNAEIGFDIVVAVPLIEISDHAALRSKWTAAQRSASERAITQPSMVTISKAARSAWLCICK